MLLRRKNKRSRTKNQKEGIKKTTFVCTSIALLDEKSTSEQRFSERKPHTLKKRRVRKKTPNPTTKAFQRGRFRAPSFPRKARLQLAAAAKQGTNGCARIENPSREMPCRDPGSSRGPSDLRSDAFPTQLSRLCAMLQMLVRPSWTPCSNNTYLGSPWIRCGGFDAVAMVWPWPWGARILSRGWRKGSADVVTHVAWKHIGKMQQMWQERNELRTLGL